MRLMPSRQLSSRRRAWSTTQEGLPAQDSPPMCTSALPSRTFFRPTIVIEEEGVTTQTNPRGFLAALVPSGTASRRLLGGAARAAASICAPCALNSLQRCSARTKCSLLRLVGPEREGFWPSVACGVTEVGYEPCRVQRIPHMGYLCMPGGHIFVRELLGTPLWRSSA